MQTIFPLPDTVVAKIAAGEVIERPAYAVKELIENAIDAHATKITIAVEESGLKKITVTDDGDGMSEEDITLCFLPHTTSKVRAEEELLHIKTLGFRGEALASLAAISTLSLQSRQEGAVGGTRIVVSKGQLGEKSPVGMPVGTQVVVSHLFSEVPVRKKFLKSEQTEFRHITDILVAYALSFPTIHFRLEHNKKLIFDLFPHDELLLRLAVVFGKGVAHDFFPLSVTDGYIHIDGFIGKPSLAAKHNQKQFVFINNRAVSDRMLSLAVREGYGTLLPSAHTPVFFLSITLPPELVDVNVHPRKEQVAFIEPKLLFTAIRQAISQTLTEQNITFNLAKFKQETSAKLGETHSFAADLLRETVLPWDRTLDAAPNDIMQFQQTYLLVPTKEGILFIDQHAAHERILYEQFLAAFQRKKIQKDHTVLSRPIHLEVSLSEAQLLEEFLDIFTAMGFIIEHFGAQSFLIRAIPAVFTGRNSEKIIRDMLSDLKETGEVASIDLKTNRMLMFLACRAAVKAGDVLAREQQREILIQLDKAPHHETCPHGRPTRIQISLAEIERAFKRR